MMLKVLEKGQTEDRLIIERSLAYYVGDIDAD
jgi:hypothetical protein